MDIYQQTPGFTVSLCVFPSHESFGQHIFTKFVGCGNSRISSSDYQLVCVSLEGLEGPPSQAESSLPGTMCSSPYTFAPPSPIIDLSSLAVVTCGFTYSHVTLTVL